MVRPWPRCYGAVIGATIVSVSAAACGGGGGETARTRLRAHDAREGRVREIPAEARAIGQPPWATLEAVWGDYDLRQRGVVAAAFLPGGRLIAAGRGGALRIWDAETRALVRELPGGAGAEITALAVAPDGRTALLGDRDGRLTLRDLADGRVLRTIESAHDAPVRFAAFALADGGARAVSYGHEHRPALAAAVPGRDLPELARGGELVRWDLTTGARLAEARVGGLDALAASPDGHRFVGCGGGRLRGWDGAGLRAMWDRDWPHGCAAAAFAEGGRSVAIVGPGGDELAVVDAASGADLAHAGRDPGERVPGAGGVAIAAAPDEHELVIAVGVTGLRFATSRGRTLARAGQIATGGAGTRPVRADGLAYAPDGSLLVTWAGDRIELWDPSLRAPIPRARGHEEPIAALAVSADGARVASASEGGTVRIWDAATGTEQARWPADAIAGGLAFLPDGERLLVAEGEAVIGARGAVTTLVRRDGAAIWRADGRVPRAPSQLSPDGARVLTIGAADGLTLHDAATGAPLWRQGRRRFETRDLLWLPDGRRFLADDERGALWLWDAATGAALEQLAAGGFRRLACSPDGARLAAAGPGLAVFDLSPLSPGRTSPAGSPRVELERDHAGAIAFTADGEALLTAEPRGALRRRPLDGGAEDPPIDLGPSQDRVTALALDAPRHRLYCGTERGVVLAFRIRN